MNLFLENGHLSPDGLNAVINEELTELQRLEAAEHLSFCDECLVQYTLLLEEDVLLAPEKPLCEPVLKRLRRRAARILFNKYTTVAAAAALVFVIWGSGVFAAPAEKLGSLSASPPAAAPPRTEIRLSEKVADATNSFFSGINDFFGSWSYTPSPSHSEEEEYKELQKREAVFEEKQPEEESKSEAAETAKQDKDKDKDKDKNK